MIVVVCGITSLGSALTSACSALRSGRIVGVAPVWYPSISLTVIIIIGSFLSLVSEQILRCIHES